MVEKVVGSDAPGRSFRLKPSLGIKTIRRVHTNFGGEKPR